MRIAMHPAVAIEPGRPPVTRQPSSTASTLSANKLNGTITGTPTSSNPFGSLFSSLSGSKTASTATTTVSPMSIFGAGASIANANEEAATPSTASTPETTAKSSAAATSATSGGSVAVQPPGIQALVTSIMNGSFQPTYVTNPAQLQEITPAGTDYMPNFYYASNQTANEMASMLGGTVVQRPAFGQDSGWNEPLANFVQLPNGQTFNAADIAYYANCGSQGPAQLTADLTGAINQGAAWTNYYTNGGQMPTFASGYVGPPISGMTYPAGTIGADGNVINPAMAGTNA